MPETSKKSLRLIRCTAAGQHYYFDLDAVQSMQRQDQFEQDAGPHGRSRTRNLTAMIRTIRKATLLKLISTEPGTVVLLAAGQARGIYSPAI